MGFGLSLILTAAGAVLAWAVNASSSAVSIHTVGIILFVVGIVGMVLSLAFWSTWAGPGYFTRSRRTVVDGGGPGGSQVTDDRITRA